jgi:hypothetical protein
LKSERRKSLLWLTGMVVSVLVCVVLAAGFGWQKEYRRASSVSIGNGGASLGALKEEGLPFSFLVMGDPHGSLVSRLLVKKAIQGGQASFMVILGDLTYHPDTRYQRYFMSSLTEASLPFPVFLVPGNHDIEYGGRDRISADWRVTPERYESLYGPRSFSFVYNNCLFILCHIDPRERDSYLGFLRDTLSRQGTGRKHVFLFMHYPPVGIGIDAGDSYPFPRQEEFLSLLESYRVTGCFFGDYHAYGRVQRKGTSLIVSGGGGGSLKQDTPEWGKFHHLLRITVNEDSVAEGMLTLSGKTVDVRGALKRWMFVHVFPVLGGSAWLLYVLFALFLLWSISSVIILSRSIREKKEVFQAP